MAPVVEVTEAIAVRRAEALALAALVAWAVAATGFRTEAEAVAPEVAPATPMTALRIQAAATAVETAPADPFAERSIRAEAAVVDVDATVPAAEWVSPLATYSSAPISQAIYALVSPSMSVVKLSGADSPLVVTPAPMSADPTTRW